MDAAKDRSSGQMSTRAQLELGSLLLGVHTRAQDVSNIVNFWAGGDFRKKR